MEGIPALTKSQSGYCDGVDFYDPQRHFAEFLEAAKKHGSLAKSETSEGADSKPNSTAAAAEKKSKKSWKKSLFSWLQKSKTRISSENDTPPPLSRPKRGSISGPISGKVERAAHGGKSSRPTSGPLSSLFQPSRKTEMETRYVSLHQLNNPRDANAFGPIYLVT